MNEFKLEKYPERLALSKSLVSKMQKRSVKYNSICYKKSFYGEKIPLEHEVRYDKDVELASKKQ